MVRRPARAAGLRRLVRRARPARSTPTSWGRCSPALSRVRSTSCAACWTHRQVWCDDVATAAVETCAERSRRRLRAGPWPGSSSATATDWRRWRWGDAHPAVLAHRPLEQQPLLRRLVQRSWCRSAATAARSMSATSGRDARRDCRSARSMAAGYRAIYDLADLDRSRWIAATRPVRPPAVAPLCATLPLPGRKVAICP